MVQTISLVIEDMLKKKNPGSGIDAPYSFIRSIEAINLKHYLMISTSTSPFFWGVNLFYFFGITKSVL